MDIASLIGAVLAGSFLSGLAAVAAIRSHNRRNLSEANSADADAAMDWQTVYRQSIDDLNRRVGDLTRALSLVRDELRDTKAAQARTERELADARVAYAELDAMTGKERHDMRDQLAALAIENQNLRHQVESLQAEIETLKAQAGVIERRSSDRRGVDPASD